ncbi:hypothetical protein DSO57_1011109 [Entomophthora muscae]|uniref:Uncharacterized protein n=1 Tax=Entomophthora muscae TaxID=34485 RepID=A0ACC2T6A6_9FUNG|nr:hypothetical protein DSO57_1011109 [Entomophthora muscae]
MKHIFLLTGFLSSLVGYNASVLDFEARQAGVLSSDQAVTKTNPLDNSTQPGQVFGQAHNSTEHPEYPKQPTHALTRRAEISYSGCKDDFNDKDHLKLWQDFTKSMETVSRDKALSVTLSKYISSSFTRVCIRVKCGGCRDLDFSAVLHIRPGLTVLLTIATKTRSKVNILPTVTAI